MEIKSGMTKEERVEVSGALSKFLADTFALYVKTQSFHWNITGPEFYSLHKMTESQYEEMAEAIDEIAERIRALGFFVDGSLETFAKMTSVPDDHKIHPKFELLQNLIDAQEIVIREARNISSLGEKCNDHATVDLMARRLGVHEKAVWMLRESI